MFFLPPSYGLRMAAGFYDRGDTHPQSFPFLFLFNFQFFFYLAPLEFATSRLEFKLYMLDFQSSLLFTISEGVLGYIRLPTPSPLFLLITFLVCYLLVSYDQGGAKD